MGAVTGVWGFVTGVWNAIVAVAPTVMHAVCQIVQSGSDAVKL